MVKASPLVILKHIRSELIDIYGQESDSLAMLLTEHLSKLDRTQIITDRHFDAGPMLNNQVKQAIDRLKNHEPLQYIIGHADFFGRQFQVNPATLIPRPETEELVQLVIDKLKGKTNLKILDIGTGTGCIPITLYLELPGSKVQSVDISDPALAVAGENARNLGAEVQFDRLDILTEEPTGMYDVIVSNPPYVLEEEKAQMQPNVLEYEPEQALFVPDASPLVFYERIAELGTRRLNSAGILFFEINERFGDQLSKLLIHMGYYNVTVHKDLQGKDRMVVAHRA